MARRIDRLLLLFDADSGWWDVIMDSACKLLSLGGEQVVLVGPESLAECKGSLVALRRRLQERAALLRLELPPIIRAA